ncbi:MAG: ATP-dependent zinc protease [Akkermansiaceae bacterium]|nr:ATP-dependent zinc protease [Akkermansiaceae bacterium]
MSCFGQAVEAPAKEAPVKETPEKQEAPVKETPEKKEAPEKKEDAATPGDKPAEVKPVKAPEAPEAPQVMGWREWVWMVKPEFVLRAKLDTGAKTCSIHASNIQAVEVDGKKWVKFTISDPASDAGARLKHKAPVVRIAKVKNDSGGLDERYVVALTFKIGDHEKTGEFSLNDRSEMNYGVLIGRNMLRELGVVDSGREYVLKKPPGAPKRKKGSVQE